MSDTRREAVARIIDPEGWQREKARKLADAIDKLYTPESTSEAMREAAAKVAECAFDDRPRSRVGHPSQMDWDDGYRDGTRAAAAAIRAIPTCKESLQVGDAIPATSAGNAGDEERYRLLLLKLLYAFDEERVKEIGIALAVEHGIAEIADLRSRACSTPKPEPVGDELRDALTEVMDWIDNWTPNFTYDDEWKRTRDKVAAALSHPLKHEGVGP